MDDKTIVDYLSEQAFFTKMDKNTISFLAQYAKEISLEKEALLFRQGEFADKFYLVRNGCISVQIPAISGPPLEIQNLNADQILGWSWLIAPYKWNFQAKAEEDSILLEFDGRAIFGRCEQDAKFGYDLLKRFAALMAERLNAARQKMMDSWNPPGFA